MSEAPAAAANHQRVLPVASADGTSFELLCVEPPQGPTILLYWLPAMGMPARQYLPLAEALAACGVTVLLHEWRGIGSSDRRAGRDVDWGYRELLESDLPAGVATARACFAHTSLCLGGHSLGGQLAVLYAALHSAACDRLLLIASGAPYWRAFQQGWLLRHAYGLAPLLARWVGYLPGRRLGFGGNEARGVIRDWARSGRTGAYSAHGMNQDFAPRLAALAQPLLALRLADDWMGPAASLDWLLGLLPQTRRTVEVVTRQDLDLDRADHFGWMNKPAPIARRVSEWLIDLPGSA